MARYLAAALYVVPLVDELTSFYALQKEIAADEASMARIWAGIHFRSAMQDTREVARLVVAYVLEHAAQPINGERVGQLDK